MRLYPAIALLIAITSGAGAQTGETAADRAARIQSVFDRGCADNEGTDRCDAEVQRRMRELYGLADAETLAGQGVVLRRAMFVDGYGNDVVAISVSRAPGRSPTVEISTPRGEQGPEPQSLYAAISQSIWQHVMDSSGNFDRRIEGERNLGELNESGGLCLHGWFVVVESVDLAFLDTVGREILPLRIRRDAEGSCGDGLAEPFAFELAEIAIKNMQECSSLEPDDARNDAALLALCHQMRGDRIAAGEAYQFTEELSSLESWPEGDRLFWLFAPVAHDLSEPFKQALDGGRFYLAPPHAIDVDHAEVEGHVVFPASEGDTQYVDIKLKLIRENAGFVILSYEISERRLLE